MKAHMNFFFSIISVLGFATAASAFTLNSSQNSNLKGWADHQVKLMVNTANCPGNVDVVALIDEAAAVWNNIATSDISVSFGGLTASTGFSSPPTVYCETSFQAVVGADPDFVPGAAAVDGTTGQITSGVLYLNASAGQANIGNFNREVLKIILAHEIGHLLGLGHSESNYALMYYDASAKTQLRLSQDDIDGMTYLYPADQLANKKLAGCGLIRQRPGGGGGTCLLLLLMPLITALALRRKGSGYSAGRNHAMLGGVF